MTDTRPILVVDDFLDGRELLSEYLEFRGFSVVAAKSGREAIALAPQIRPSAVLMDLGMPDIDGWEATRRLRQNPDTRDVMIIAVTAHALTREVQAALDAGCDAVVAKPYDLAAFADALAASMTKGPSAFKAVGAPTKTRSSSPASSSRAQSSKGRSRTKEP
jgi:two-component system cell cycle response regulator DivK